jgi:hypothetical protein
MLCILIPLTGWWLELRFNAFRRIVMGREGEGAGQMGREQQIQIRERQHTDEFYGWKTVSEEINDDRPSPP